MSRRGHDQAQVRYHDRTIKVDIGMVPLLRALWADGIETYGSCEDTGRGSAMIWFADEKSSQRFRDLTEGMWVGTAAGDHWPLGFILSEAEEAFGVL